MHDVVPSPPVSPSFLPWYKNDQEKQLVFGAFWLYDEWLLAAETAGAQHQELPLVNV